MNAVREYEVMAVHVVNTEEVYENTVKKYQDLIQGNDGKLVKTERWGKKRLAYEIKGKSEGLYTLFIFKCAEDKTIREIDRLMKIDENIMRHLILRKD